MPDWLLDDNENEAKAPEGFFMAPRTTELALLSIGTLNLYQFYWFYRNWQAIQVRTNTPFSPLLRSVFCVFFAYLLFDETQLLALKKDMKANFQPAFLALLYFALSMTVILPGYFWIPSLLSFVPLISINKIAQNINNQEHPDIKVRFGMSHWHWLWITPFYVLFILLINFGVLLLIGIVSPSHLPH